MKIKKRKMNKQAFISLPILFLVILEVALIIFTIAYFDYQKSSANNKILLANNVDEVYAQQALVNFNLQNIFDRAVFGFSPEFGKDFFIKRFKDELNNYKNSSGDYIIPELNQVESQMTSDNILLDNEKISFNLNIHLKNKPSETDIRVDYDYTKGFEKVFNPPIPIVR